MHGYLQRFKGEIIGIHIERLDFSSPHAQVLDRSNNVDGKVQEEFA
jgi:hypothetical protein